MGKSGESTMSTRLTALHHLLPPSPSLLELLPPLRLNYHCKVCYSFPASIFKTLIRPVSHILSSKAVDFTY